VPRARPSSENAPPKDSGLETVLVCDDDGDVRELLTRILGLRAYSILSAKQRQAGAGGGRTGIGGRYIYWSRTSPCRRWAVFELVAKLRKTHPDLLVLYISGYTEHAEMLTGPLGPKHLLSPESRSCRAI